MSDLPFSASLDTKDFHAGLDRMGKSSERAATGIDRILKFSVLKKLGNMAFREGADALRAWAEETERGREAMERLERGVRIVQSAIGESIYDWAQWLPGIGHLVRTTEEIGKMRIELEKSGAAITRRHENIEAMRQYVHDETLQRWRESPPEDAMAVRNAQAHAQAKATRDFESRFRVPGMEAGSIEEKLFYQGLGLARERAVGELNKAQQQYWQRKAEESAKEVDQRNNLREQISLEIQRNDIDIERLRGHDLIADKMAVELEFAERIEKARKATLLADDEREALAGRLEQQRSEVLSLLGRRGAGTTTLGGNAIISGTLIRQVFGSGGRDPAVAKAEQQRQRAVDTLNRIEQNTRQGAVAVME